MRNPWPSIKNFFAVKRNIVITALIVMIISLGIGGFLFFKDSPEKTQQIVATSSSNNLYNFSFNGNHEFADKHIRVEQRGSVIFVVPENVVFKCITDSGAELVSPWSNKMYFVVSYNGEKRKISSPKSFMIIPSAGEITVRVEYDPEFFDPFKDKAWTGVKSEQDFIKQDLSLFVKNASDKLDSTKFTEVEEIKKKTEKKTVVDQPSLSIVDKIVGVTPDSKKKNAEFWRANPVFSEDDVNEFVEEIQNLFGNNEEK